MTSSRNIPFGRPWITDADREAVMEVLQGHILTHGPQGQAFEKEFAAFAGDQAHCVTVSSGMAASAFSLSPFRHRRGGRGNRAGPDPRGHRPRG